MKRLTILAIVAAPLLFLSCGKGQSDGGKDSPNEFKPIQLSSSQRSFVQQGNTFGMSFLSQVAKSTADDFVISPLSMQFLLGMVLNGARGTTADEICSVLGYGAGDVAGVNAFCAKMLTSLPAIDKKTKLTLANAIVVDDGYSLLPAYMDSVRTYYDAMVDNLDFFDKAGSAAKINKWCSDHTEGLIPKVLDETDPDMLAYLLNALYFKSKWSEQFEKNATRNLVFTREDNTSVYVPMMAQVKDFPYQETSDFKAVRLPYGNGAFVMTVLLPLPGRKTSDILSRLASSGLDGIHFEICHVDLQLPRFETRFGDYLNNILSAMGMPSAFSATDADLSGMSPDAMRLSYVRQDAVIKVDEEGSEAAAVSSAAVEKNYAAAPGENVVFHADHPFIYLISESSTGAILFAGRYSCKSK